MDWINSFFEKKDSEINKEDNNIIIEEDTVENLKLLLQGKDKEIKFLKNKVMFLEEIDIRNRIKRRNSFNVLNKINDKSTKKKINIVTYNLSYINLFICSLITYKIYTSNLFN